MRNRIALILILAAGLMAGCKSRGIKPGEARISGTMTPAVPGYLKVTAGPVLDSTRIRKNGEFSLLIPVTEPIRATLLFGNRITNVYLEPGKEISLTINPLNFSENIGYGGELGPVNHYLTLARKLDQQISLPAGELYSIEPERFIRLIDSIKDIKIKLLDEYVNKYKEIDPGFVRVTRSEIELAWAGQHLQYPVKYQILTGRNPAIPEGYHFDYLNQLNLNLPTNLKSQVYREFIQSYLDYRQSVYLANHPKTWDLIFPESVARFRVIHQEFTDPDIVDHLLFIAMQDHLANFGTTRVETFLTDFRVTCKNPEYIRLIENLAANMDKIGLGQPAPDFTAFTPEGNRVNLSDYFGQLLYIGFWASWSDWSLQEIPFFEQLRKDFEGRSVKFILISMDFEKDKNRWSAIISKNKFGSIQLMQDPKSTVLSEKYFLNDFPRYLLIGHDGKIISAYAPRPTENIAESIRRILNRAD